MAEIGDHIKNTRTEALVSLRDACRKDLQNHLRNAERMQQILNQMNEEIAQRTANKNG